MEAAATITQLTSLVIRHARDGVISCLGALKLLQSLSLKFMHLEDPGLYLVAQQCSHLTRLVLSHVSISTPPPDQPQPACSWPALQELQLDTSLPAGFIIKVIPPGAAPLLARLATPTLKVWPGRWPKGLQGASIEMLMDQLTTTQQLAADLSCLAACPAPCQALQLRGNAPKPEQAAQLAAAVALLAPTLTHLSMRFWTEVESQPLEELCMALPLLRSLQLVYGGQPFPAESRLLLLHPSLCQLLLSGSASAEWVKQLLAACDAASAAPRPQGTLTVELPSMGGAELAAAREMWAQLAAKVASPASRVVVTDHEGRDLLAALVP